MGTYKINIVTLSPVHIGDGVTLRYGSDFIKEDAHKGGGKSLYIIDPNKIGKIVGRNRRDMESWMIAIKGGVDALQFVQGMNRSKQAKDIALREIPIKAHVKVTGKLKTCIHDGLGRPYIPGSSIKGAIRTAVLTSLVPGVEKKKSKVADENNRTGYSARKIEEELFGNDPYNDLFRFLQVGDAYFKAGSEISLRMVNLNIRESTDLLDTRFQLIEAIKDKNKADFSIKIPDNLLERYKDNNNNRNYYSFLNISELFKIINAHTRKLLEDEIKFWKYIENKEWKTGADNYLKNLGFIQEYVKNCKDGRECVLRVGHASGWRFITGAWAEELEPRDFKSIANSIRRMSYYQKYPFPKTRRIVQEPKQAQEQEQVQGQKQDLRGVLGFVKLSINE